MKRVKERTQAQSDNPFYVTKNGVKYHRAEIVGPVIIAMVFLTVLLLTTQPGYKMVDGEVVSSTRNSLLGLEIPVNYYWVIAGFAAVFIPLAVYRVTVCEVQNPLPEWADNIFALLSLASIFIGGASLLAMPIANAIEMGTNKSEAVITEYTKPYEASPTLKPFDSDDKVEKLDNLISEVKGTGGAETDNFIKDTFNKKNKSTDSYDYLYSVIEKNGEYRLVAILKGKTSLDDVSDFGEISKSQSRAFAELTKEL